MVDSEEFISWYSQHSRLFRFVWIMFSHIFLLQQTVMHLTEILCDKPTQSSLSLTVRWKLIYDFQNLFQIKNMFVNTYFQLPNFFNRIKGLDFNRTNLINN